jgi:hypothetical protein
MFHTGPGNSDRRDANGEILSAFSEVDRSAPQNTLLVALFNIQCNWALQVHMVESGTCLAEAEFETATCAAEVGGQ